MKTFSQFIAESEITRPGSRSSLAKKPRETFYDETTSDFPNMPDHAGLILTNGKVHWVNATFPGIHSVIAKKEGFEFSLDAENSALEAGLVRYIKNARGLNLDFNGLNPKAAANAIRAAHKLYVPGKKIYIDIRQGKWHNYDKETVGEVDSPFEAEKFIKRGVIATKHRQEHEPVNAWDGCAVCGEPAEPGEKMCRACRSKRA